MRRASKEATLGSPKNDRSIAYETLTKIPLLLATAELQVCSATVDDNLIGKKIQPSA
jgi:hypothetical protein